MSPVRRIAAGLALATVATLAIATPASAHDQLMSSTPAADEQLAAAPESITIPDGLAMGSGMTMAQDAENRWVILFDSDWAQRYFEQRNPDVQLLELPE